MGYVEVNGNKQHTQGPRFVLHECSRDDGESCLKLLCEEGGGKREEKSYEQQKVKGLN